jgi:hypothetical protein
MISIHNPHQLSQSERSRLLAASLRQLRLDTDRAGAADLVHQLRNSILTVQGALSLVEARLTKGQDDEIETLLDLAEARLRDGRALIARAQRSRFIGRRTPTLHAA